MQMKMNEFTFICSLFYWDDLGKELTIRCLVINQWCGIMSACHSAHFNSVPCLGARIVSFKQQWCCRWWWWRNLRGHRSCLNNKVYYKTIAGQDGCLGITRRRSQSNRSLKWQGRAHRYIGRLFFSQTWEKITLHIWFSTESGNEHIDHFLGRDLVWNTWGIPENPKTRAPQL